MPTSFFPQAVPDSDRFLYIRKRRKKMAKYRDQLPQLSGDVFLIDEGIETTLIFNEGLELPYFAAFDLLKHPAGEAALQKDFRTYAALARRYGVDARHSSSQRVKIF
jgi:hypothetical protein